MNHVAVRRHSYCWVRILQLQHYPRLVAYFGVYFYLGSYGNDNYLQIPKIALYYRSLFITHKFSWLSHGISNRS